MWNYASKLFTQVNIFWKPMLESTILFIYNCRVLYLERNEMEYHACTESGVPCLYRHVEYYSMFDSPIFGKGLIYYVFLLLFTIYFCCFYHVLLLLFTMYWNMLLFTIYFCFLLCIFIVIYYVFEICCSLLCFFVVIYYVFEIRCLNLYFYSIKCCIR